MKSDELLDRLHQCVAAEPAGPDGQTPNLCNELLSRIQHVRGSPFIGLKRSQKRALADLLNGFPAADQDAVRDLNLRIMGALPGSTEIVEALKKVGAEARLQAADIVKDEQMWARLADNRNGELAAVAGALGLSVPAVLYAITASSLSTAARYDPRWLRRHAFDWLGAVLLCVVLGMLARIVLPGLPPLTATQLVVTRDMQPFEPITAREVIAKITNRKPGAFSHVADIVGRYSTVPLVKDTIPTSADLSAGQLPDSLKTPSVLRVPLKPGKAALPWKLPAKVTLVVVPRRSGSAPLLLHDTWILALQNNGDNNGDTSMAWMTVDSTKLPEVAAALSDADIFLAQP